MEAASCAADGIEDIEESLDRVGLADRDETAAHERAQPASSPLQAAAAGAAVAASTSTPAHRSAPTSDAEEHEDSETAREGAVRDGAPAAAAATGSGDATPTMALTDVEEDELMLLDLPDELLCMVFGYLDIVDLARVAQVSRRLHEVGPGCEYSWDLVVRSGKLQPKLSPNFLASLNCRSL